MASGNLALAFGGLLAGAVVVDYGVKAVRNEWNGTSTAPASANKSASSTPPTTGKIVSSNFTSDQQTFAQQLATQTGLDLHVIYAWMAAEEPPGLSSAPNGKNNWLNIGSTDSGYFGGSNPAWKDPTAAANQTASWLAGGSTVGYGNASGGIQKILASVGSGADAQVVAIRNSGWASSGYPLLAEVYQEVLNGLGGVHK